MILEIFDKQSLQHVGIIVLDQHQGTCRFESGPPMLQQLVEATLSKGVFRSASERTVEDGQEVYLSFSELVPAEDPSFFRKLGATLARMGFYTREQADWVRDQRKKTRATA